MATSESQAPKKTGLMELILQSQGSQFVIPVYQRNYTWTTGKEVKQYFNDLKAVLLGQYDKHFMGIMIYLDTPISFSSREFSVIDGQQRLTTTFLLLYAVKEINERTLLPTEEDSIKMLSSLYDKGLIILSVKNYLNSFTFDNNNNATSFDLDNVYFDLWIKEETACDELLNATFNLSKEAKLSYWQEINKLEAINYLISVFEKIKIYDFNPGKKTNEVFDKLVEKFSLSQIFRMINYVTDKTSKDILSKEKTVQHAANATISRIESYAARALFEGYSLYKVKYDDNLSMVTTYFYNRVLCMGDSAFYEIPQMELII